MHCLQLMKLVTCFLLVSVGVDSGSLRAQPPFAIAPFDASQARQHQSAWAAHLKQPVQQTNSIQMTFALIPPGEFTMGSPDSEKGRIDNERLRKVKLANPFRIGVTEVTQAQYSAVMGKNPSAFKGADRPVENVSWDEAVEFCKRLSELPAEKSARRVYRLPREDEWEFACRAGTTTIFYFGEDVALADQHVWYKANSGGQSHPVGQKLANPWGLYDMLGNVFEWCAIEPAGDHRFLTVDSRGLYETWGQVYRGGSWINLEARFRSATRSVYKTDFTYYYLGFRVVMDSTP